MAQKLPSGAKLEIFDTLDSTSAEAKRRARDGEHGPLWIVAVEQTAGYGRRGRSWESAAGNFTGTFLFEPEGDAALFGQLSFVIALAVFDAVEPMVRSGALSLKWPNDVLGEGAKLAGLLLERIDHDGAALVAVGVGVNIASAPQDLPYKATTLAALSDAPTPSPEQLVCAVDAAFQRRYALWAGQGFSPIREAWLARARGVGDDIRVRLPNEECSGVFAGIDQTGALILAQGETRRLVAAGEIMFGE